MLHLVQPVWDSPAVGFSVLLDRLEEPHTGDGPAACFTELLRWIRVPLARCCFHSTVSVRRLGLAGLLGLGEARVEVLTKVRGQGGGWRVEVLTKV